MRDDGWITDREPTVEECKGCGIWVTPRDGSGVYRTSMFYKNCHFAWQPANVPAPYVPPPEPQRCPFCGDSVETRKWSNCYYISCPRARCRFVGPSRETPSEAIVAWNRIMVKQEATS